MIRILGSRGFETGGYDCLARVNRTESMPVWKPRLSDFNDEWILNNGWWRGRWFGGSTERTQPRNREGRDLSIKAGRTTGVGTGVIQLDDWIAC